jgi:Fe2+ transport system protein B
MLRENPRDTADTSANAKAPLFEPPRADRGCVVVVGKESVGKSELISSLTGKEAYSANFRGSTVSCDVYEGAEVTLIDTPGILRQSDSKATQMALAQLRDGDRVLLVIPATHVDQDLGELLPLLQGKRGAIAVTFGDKVSSFKEMREKLALLSEDLGVSLSLVNAKKLGATEREQLLAHLESPSAFTRETPRVRVGIWIEPKASVFDHRIAGPVIAVALLFAPAVAAIWVANSFAAAVEGQVQAAIGAAADQVQQWSPALHVLLGGRYGLITMGPLLLVWAIPTVILYALFIGVYKASGIIDRITVAMHPLVRPFGLAGRDMVRVMMGFGCNVPAVINTRASSACSRGACISAIAFGSACSYQLGATLAVFGAAHAGWLAVPYLSFLVLTTLIYLRLTAPKESRSRHNLLVIDGRNFIEWPRPSAIWREARIIVVHFFRRAMPIFIGITFIASLLDWTGVLAAASRVLGPIMSFFNLPPEAALPLVMASIRKDGILLLSEPGLLAKLGPWQVLTAVYLTGVLLPCIVTLVTIAREQSMRFALRLVARQAVAAVFFAVSLSWGSVLVARWFG